jgi:DNA-binding transcriptional LysR family regulator
MDRLTGMKVFSAVARLGSFSAAAKELKISRAMASKFINDLEGNLGARLLNRTTRKLSLTEVGQAYFERINNILTEIEEADLSVTELQTEPVGTLKIMSPPSFGSFHLARAITGYKEQFPNVNIELILTDGIPDLIEEGMDMAIQLGELEDSNVIARKLSSSRLVVCGSPEYFAKYNIPETPQQLSEHNCLKLIQELPIIDWKLKIDGKEKKINVSGNLKSNMADSLRIAAINGCGLVQLPTYMVGLDIKSGRLKPVLEKYEPGELPIHAIYAHRKYLSAKVRTFINYIQSYFQSPPYWDKWMFTN